LRARSGKISGILDSEQVDSSKCDQLASDNAGRANMASKERHTNNNGKIYLEGIWIPMFAILAKDLMNVVIILNPDDFWIQNVESWLGRKSVSS
jgi:hypothetical protein